MQGLWFGDELLGSLSAVVFVRTLSPIATTLPSLLVEGHCALRGEVFLFFSSTELIILMNSAVIQ
jgi:hypothetical protein